MPLIELSTNQTSEQLIDKALVHASTYFLTKPLPKGWQKFDQKKLMHFVKNNSPEKYQDTPPEYVLKAILELSEELVNFFTKTLEELEINVTLDGKTVKIPRIKKKL